MSNAQAQAVAHDLVAAGYSQTSSPLDAAGTNWKVDAGPGTNTAVNCGTVQTFATNHGVTATTSQVTFQ